MRSTRRRCSSSASIYRSSKPTTRCALRSSPARARKRSAPVPTSRKKAAVGFRSCGTASVSTTAPGGQALNTTKPLIAAINGYCLAGGLELALNCDIRIASTSASFGSPEVRWSLLQGYGALRLPQTVSLSLAMDMLLTGERIDAKRAYEAGLISRLVAPGRSHADCAGDGGAHQRERAARRAASRRTWRCAASICRRKTSSRIATA